MSGLLNQILQSSPFWCTLWLCESDSFGPLDPSGTWSCICQVSSEETVGVWTRWKPQYALAGVGSFQLQRPKSLFFEYFFWVNWELILGKCWEKWQCYQRTGRSLMGRKSRLWNRKALSFLCHAVHLFHLNFWIYFNTFWYESFVWSCLLSRLFYPL